MKKAGAECASGVRNTQREAEQRAIVIKLFVDDSSLQAPGRSIVLNCLLAFCIKLLTQSLL